MIHLSKFHRCLLTSSALVTAAVSALPAHALGTPAGSEITLSATVTYDNGGTPATINGANRTVKVDRIITFQIQPVDVDNNALNLAPGTDNARQAFKVFNFSNAPVQFNLKSYPTPDRLTPSPAVYDLRDPKLYIDKGSTDKTGDSVLNVTTDIDVSLIQGPSHVTVPADGEVLVWIYGKIPDTAQNGDGVTVTLEAVAVEGAAGATNPLVAQPLYDQLQPTADGLYTLFTDVASRWDAERNGKDVAGVAMTVSTSILKPIFDPSTTRDPIHEVSQKGYQQGLKLPGSNIWYCVGYYNPPTGTPVDNVTISLDVPSAVQFDTQATVIKGYVRPTTAYTPNACPDDLKTTTEAFVTGAFSTSTTGNVAKVTVPTIPAGNSAFMVVTGTLPYLQ